MRYIEKLNNAVKSSHSCLCIGLDPHISLFPESVTEQYPDVEQRVVHFLRNVVEITHPYCAAYKPNMAFFEALGMRGHAVLDEVLEAVPPDKVIIADAKRGDIGSTSEYYKKAFFDVINADAVTLNPLLGFETFKPYLSYEDKAVYSLVLTSNPGSLDFLAKSFEGYTTMAGYIANRLSRVQEGSDAALGMVIGATHPDLFSDILEEFPRAPLLIPGIGTQGGDLEDLTESLSGYNGMPLISTSRSILFAGNDSDDWKPGIENAAKDYKNRLKAITETYA